MAYLPSSVLSGSSAAMQLSSSSKTDGHSDLFFLNCCCAILLSGRLSIMVSLKHALLVDGPGFAERGGATETKYCQQKSHVITVETAM